MGQLYKMNPSEIQELSQQWLAHLDLLEGRVDANLLYIARSAVQPDNFGWEQGQLRPSPELAKFDLYYLLVAAPGVPDALLISRLTDRELTMASEQEDLDEFLRECMEDETALFYLRNLRR